MTSRTTVHAAKVTPVVANPDVYTWANPLGGTWGTAANWTDVTTGLPGAAAPGAANAVSVAGTATTFTDVVGTGAASQLAVSGDVLLWGSVAVGGAVTLAALGAVGNTDLELDGAATLVSSSLAMGSYGSLELGGGSTSSVTGAASLSLGAVVIVDDGSTARFGSLVADQSTIAVDGNSVLEVGTAGGAAAGFMTIDKGWSAAISGTITSNLTVNGTLGVQAGATLVIDQAASAPDGTAATHSETIDGTGTIALSENSTLVLGVADGAAIQFNGPAGRLQLDVLPTGTIAGFAAGDSILLAAGLATGLRYTQTSATVATLTLTKGGKAAGTLTLAGNYAGSLFHLGVGRYGEQVTVRTVGGAGVPPSLIVGSAGADNLYATADNQTLTGLGGNDTLSTNGFAGTVFKDTSANLDGSTLTGFAGTGVLDLTDMSASSATTTLTPAVYVTNPYFGSPTPGTLKVTDGTHTAVLTLATPTVPLSAGYYATATDGSGGTDVRFVTVNTDAYAFASALGGGYAPAGNWTDDTTALPALLAPSYGNDVTIAGGKIVTSVTGSGAAASLTTSGNVELLGSLLVGSLVSGVSGNLTQGGTLALDGGAALTLAGSALVGGRVQVGGRSHLTAGSLTFAQDGGSLLVAGGSAARFLSVTGVANGPFPTVRTSTLAIDSQSSIEVGAVGNAVKGALTVDAGVTAELKGSIYGNLVVGGKLAVTNYGTLRVAGFGPGVASVAGTGTLDIGVGSTLTLLAGDTAAILFEATGNQQSSGTLALGRVLPTGLISGFVAGDRIAVGQPVTKLTYAETSPGQGTLSLFDGATAVGTLALAGSYNASQFDLQSSGSGATSSISYLTTPGSASGGQTSTTTDTFSWSGATGGSWSNPANWTDATTGTPAEAAPGSSNVVAMNYFAHQAISGGANAASMAITYSTPVFTGSVTVAGVLSVYGYGNNSGSMSVVNGAALSAGSLDLHGGVLEVASGSTATINGASNDYGSIMVMGASTVRLAGGLVVGGNSDVAVDATSAAVVGPTGRAATGKLTVDAAQTLSLFNGTVSAGLVVNGTLIAGNGGGGYYFLTPATDTIQGFAGLAGSVTGAGTIDIAGGSTLVLNATDTAATTFQTYHASPFAPAYYSTLEVVGALPTGLLGGFVAGDSIVFDRTVTGASFAQTTATQGVLTLTDGGAAAGTLTLAGNYANSLFHLDGAAATGVSTLSLQTPAGPAGSAAAGTTKDAYTWTGASGGTWATAANWKDTTAPATTTVVPGANDAVTIAGSGTTIGGKGAAASLALGGKLLLTGQTTVAGSVVTATGAQVALDGGATLTAGLASIGGSVQAGGNSVATVTGTATLVGGALLAIGGSTIQLGGLVGNGIGDTIAIDANSVVAVGASTNPAKGALTVASNKTVALSGAIYGSVVANGTVAVAAGRGLAIDMAGSVSSDPYATTPATIAGSGLLRLNEGSTLALGVADTAAIQFSGPNATLQLAKLPTASIFGFASGDLITVDQAATGLAYKQVSAGVAQLTLTNGAATLGTLKLIGAFGAATQAFHLDGAVDGSFATISLQSIGVAALQPAMVSGTAASDQLAATANGQTLTGYGGGDTLGGNAFSGLDFKDTAADLGGSAIQNFGTSDVVDLTDVAWAKASVTYAGGIVSATDGAHAATFNLGFATQPATGGFTVANDGGGGTTLTWH